MDEQTLKKLTELKNKQKTQDSLSDPQTRAGMALDPELGQKTLDLLLGSYGPTSSQPDPTKPEPGLSSDMGMLNPIDYLSAALPGAKIAKSLPKISQALNKTKLGTKAMASKVEPVAENIIGKQALEKPHFLFTSEKPRYLESIKPEYKNLSNKDIIDLLKKQGIESIPVKGMYGMPEESIAALNVDSKKAERLHQLAKDLGQESSIYSRGGKQEMRYHGGENVGKSHYGEGTEFHTKAPEDYYTTLPSGETFTHKFKFDELKPQGQIEKTLTKTPTAKASDFNLEEAKQLSKDMDKKALEQTIEHYNNPENWQNLQDVAQRQHLIEKYKQDFPESFAEKYGKPLTQELPPPSEVTEKIKKATKPRKESLLEKIKGKKPTGLEQEDVVKDIDLDAYQQAKAKEEQQILPKLKKLLKYK
jgi:hypothetical protein